MMLRTLLAVVFGLGLFFAAPPARADHLKLRLAFEELERAKDHLAVEKKHQQVEKAHRALKDAIKYVRESKSEFGGRRKRLIERLEVLDRQLEREHTRARKALDEAIEDLKFANAH